MYLSLCTTALISLFLISSSTSAASIFDKNNNVCAGPCIGDNTTHVTLQACHEDWMTTLMLVSLFSTKEVDNQKLKQFSLDTCEFFKQQLGHYIIISAHDNNTDAQKEIRSLPGGNESELFQKYLQSKGYPSNMTDMLVVK